MSPRLPGAPCVLVAAMMLALAVPEASAYPGFGRRAYETVYVPSSGSILLDSTAYYVPTVYASTSYYVPTVYTSTSYVPTRYVVSSTSYLRPTAYYVPTRYVVERPVVSTSSIVERAYYVPTVTALDLPLVRTTSSSPLCCDDTLGSSSGIVSDEPVYALPPEASNDDTNEIPAPANRPSGSSASSSPVSGGEPDLNPGDIHRQPPVTRQSDSPPPAGQPSNTAEDPLPLIDPNDDPPAPRPAPAGLDINPPPAPPAEDVSRAPSATDGGSQRTTLRPTYTRPLAEARSQLLGKVLSAVSGDPEDGVLVTLTNRSGRFEPRTATTASDGTFSITLPEGDWTVAVPKPNDPAGALTIDRDITVSGGVITDDQDRQVTLMSINR